MSSPSGDEAAAATVAAGRFNPKWLLVAGASALLLVIGAAGVALWLWPKAPDPAEARAARLAARRAAAQASAPVALPAAAAASAADDGDAAVAAAHEPPASAADAATETLPEAPVPPAPRAAEASLDRLQRRLGEVLGVAVEPASGGELRVLTRASQVVPVGHAPRAAAAPGRAPRVGATGHAVHWGYDGVGGPQAWGRLKPEFSQCAAGQRQSPIDIRDGIALDLEPVQFDYRPGGFAVIDNGHTVQVNVAPGNTIEVNGRRYALQQFHFHRPSEERVDGRQFEMDVHLVHKDADGRLAVVAVLLERGAAQPLLQTVWSHLPLEKHEEVAARAQIDPGQLLPADRRYYTYMGSLTTPPCSEGVLWLVMQQPVPVSAQQIDVFARLYPMNARPLQQAAGRLIKQSN